MCLIGLDTNNRAIEWPGHFYDEGAISREQLAFLRVELDAARERDELVIVATHHPSSALRSGYGSETTGTEFRALLNEYPNVILHLAGHRHRNRVMEQGGYLEIETCSTLDLPQEGRLIEIWYDETDSSVVVTYEMFMHIDDTLPALGEDPLRGLRETALAIARGDKGAEARQKRFDSSGADPYGQPTDSAGGLCLRWMRILNRKQMRIPSRPFRRRYRAGSGIAIPSAVMTCFKSSQTLAFSPGLRSKYAG